MPLSIPIDDPVGVFALVLALALLAPYLAGKLRLPGVIGLALAGMAIGPRGLGLVAPGGAVELLGTIGSCYVFFVAGAETDLGQLRRAGRDGLVFFALSFGLAFAIAAVTGMGLLGMGLLPALLLGCVHGHGAILPASLSGRPSLGKQRAVLAAAAAAALSALLSVLALAAFVHANGGAADRGLPLTAIAAAAWIASLFAVPAAAGLFFKKVKPDGKLEFAFVMASAFLVAYLAGVAGFEPSAGAFCAGLLLARFLPESGALVERIKFAGGSLLVPFLMVWMGTLADPLALFAGVGATFPGALSAGLLAALVLTALNLCAKWLAAGGAAFLLRYSAAERNLLFGLSAERSVLTLAIALLGFRSGLLGQDALCGAILLVAAGCILGPLAARGAAAHLSGVSVGAVAAEAPPERILVAVSNPSSVRSLVDLAFLLRDRRSEEPVYPVAVVPESENSREEIAAAESHLAQAIVQGVSAGVPVAPSTRVSVNAPDGILRAARENRASAIVIGWNKTPKLSHAFFGSVIEQVIMGGPELVVVARITRQPATVTQVVLVVPPFLSRHPGFPRAARAIASLLSRTGARLSVFTQMGAGTEVRKALAVAKVHGQTQVTELDSWKELCKAAHPADPAACAFVLLGSRPGEVAWHPAIDKLPHMIGEVYPESALLLLYLPGPSAEPAPEAEEAPPVAAPASIDGTSLLARAIGAGRVAVAMPDSAITDGIRELLKTSFGSDRRLLGRLTSLFTEIAQKQPIELEPGIVLLHAHVEEVEEPVLFFGSRAEGFRLLALEEPVRILIVLCAPAKQSPEDHLKTLGEIAALFKDPSLAKRLVAAKSAAELLDSARV